MKYFGWGVLILIGLFFLNLILGTCNTANKMVDNAQKVVYEEFKPEELLKKYSWFKDASAQLDGMVATLGAYETREKKRDERYGKDALKWPRDVQDQADVAQSEYIGIKANYNQLAAQYNANMVKFQTKFCNVGDLPKGATVALPREYKPYIDN